MNLLLGLDERACTAVPVSCPASSACAMRRTMSAWTATGLMPRFAHVSPRFPSENRASLLIGLKWMVGWTIISLAMDVVRRSPTWRTTYVKT